MVTKFSFPRSIAVESLRDGCDGDGKFGLKEVVRTSPQGILLGEAVELLSAASPENDAVVQIADENGSKIKESGLEAELFVREPAIGDVTQNYCEKLFAINLGLRDRGIDGKFVAIGTNAKDGIEAAHPAASGVGFAKITYVAGMLNAKALGDETIERGTKGKRRLTAEHHLGSRIEHGDAVVGVYGNDGIHRRSDDRGEPSFMFGDGLLDTTALGNVAGDLGGTDDRAGRIAERRDGDRHKYGSPIFADASRFIVSHGLTRTHAAKDGVLFR